MSALGRQILDRAFANNSTAETSTPTAQHEIFDESPVPEQIQRYNPTCSWSFQEHFNHPQENQPEMDYNNYANSAYAGYGYAAPPGYNAQYAQQAQYQAAPPTINNPFKPPPPPPTTIYAGQNAQFDPDEQQLLAQWQSAYAPAEQQDRAKKGAKNDRADGSGAAPAGQRGAEAETKSKADDGKFTVVRKGGGESWEDKSLLEWDPTKFRIMVGNLAGEVTDDSLTKAFAAYGVNKARVIRDKRTTKSKGFGFVEFTDGEQGFKAAREMSGKYIGSHPVTIQRARTNVAPVVKKDSNKHRGKNNNYNKNKDNKQQQKDPLKANTGAGIEKKQAAKPAPGLKLLG